MRRCLALLIAFACSPVVAHAADLDVLVRTGRGAPVADAVVTVETGTRAPVPAHFAQPLVMTQRHLQFDPFVLVVPAGAEVRFPNEDVVRHQVYSFSPAKALELKLYGRDQTRAVRFDKPGVVALGCNIHDQMVAFIKVVDTPFAVKTDAGGHALIRDLPAGSAVVQVWHPYLKSPDSMLKLELAIPGAGVVSRAVAVDLRTPAMRMSTY
jgi:plastocyanin